MTAEFGIVIEAADAADRQDAAKVAATSDERQAAYVCFGVEY
jgi:hypothetical protein